MTKPKPGVPEPSAWMTPDRLSVWLNQEDDDEVPLYTLAAARALIVEELRAEALEHRRLLRGVGAVCAEMAADYIEGRADTTKGEA